MKLLFLFTSLWAQENGSEHLAGHSDALTIPWSNIAVQALNLGILLGLLTYLLRKSLKQHFAQRAMEYRELVDRAENAAKEAEQTNRQIKDKLARLEFSASQSEARARQEAEDLRQRLIQEAKALTAKFEVEAQGTASVELEKAKGELRRELLGQALATSQTNLLKSLGTSDQKKLQNEFVEKIELVGR